jgi:cytochrome c oxidase subunit 1
VSAASETISASATVGGVGPAFDVADALHAEHSMLDLTWQRARGIFGWLGETNHKAIGLRFIITAMCFFTLAGLLAVMMRIQLAVPENSFLSADSYNQIFTTHGTAMMFLFAVPVMEGMGIYLVPLMVGTRNVSFPRLLNFSYYLYLIAGVALFISFFSNMGPDMGWFAYTPLSGPAYAAGHRMDIWSQMVTLTEISAMATAIEIITTILKQRAVGMSLNRMPIFVWAQLITNFMVIFAMPAVSLGSTMLSMDRVTHISTHFYNAAEGGDNLLWQHLFWFFAHPEVYIIFIPGTAFVSSIIPVFTRRKMFGYTALVLSMVATAFIGFGVWVHHMFATPIPDLGQGLFTASSLMIVIPNSVQMFCWIATIWGARSIRLKTPMLYVLAFIATFVIGGLTGVMLASVSVDTQVHDTFFVVAHLHYVLIGGAVFPLFGAFHYWYPKWTGRMMSEKLARFEVALVFIGFHLTFWPMHQLGLHGMTRRIYTYLPETNWGMLNHIASSGAAVLGTGILLLFINLLMSRLKGELAGANPWGAGTLEWSTLSPPPSYNFLHLPTCQGREPLWENKPDAPVVTGLSLTKRQTLATSALDAHPDHRYNFATESIVPTLCAAGTSWILLGGGIFNPWHAVWGSCFVTVVLFAWFWTARSSKHAPEKRHGINTES